MSVRHNLSRAGSISEGLVQTMFLSEDMDEQTLNHQ